jgi:hypothetical protein
MGDAFTAVNDDEFTLFYNPASMARHSRDFTLAPLIFQFSSNNILEDLEKFKDLPDGPAEISQLLIDHPIHASVGTVPGFKLFNVGMSFIANESYEMMLRNRTHPMLDLDLRTDRGFVLGVGLPLGPGRISRKGSSGSQTSIGFSTKYIERTGVQDTLAVTGTQMVSALSQDELQKILQELGQVRGIGWGFDAGLEHVVREGNTQYVVGLSALDITHTKFKMDFHPDNLRVADNRSQLNLGLAAGQNLGYLNYIVSADIRSLQDKMDFGRRLRLGGQIGIPGFRFMGGINSGYYSYGASLDIGFMELTAGFYGVEIGSKYKQLKNSRFLLYLSLFDFSFDS